MTPPETAAHVVASPRGAMPPYSPIAGFLGAAHLSFRQSVQGPRKWLLLLAGAVYPALLAFFVFVDKGGQINPFMQLFSELYVVGIAVFIAILGAIPAFSSDVEDGTVVYLFSRPTPRAVIVLGKWVGAMIPLLVISVIPVLAAWPMALRQRQPYQKEVYVYDKVTRAPEPTRPDREPGRGTESRPGGEFAPGYPDEPAGHWETRTVESRREVVQTQHLVAAIVSTLVSVLAFGTIFFSVGVIFNRPYLISLIYAVIVEIMLGKLLQFRFYVIGRFVRSVGLRLLDPTPGYFKYDLLELVPSLTWSIIALVAIPALALGAACFIASRKSYVGKSNG